MNDKFKGEADALGLIKSDLDQDHESQEIIRALHDDGIDWIRSMAEGMHGMSKPLSMIGVAYGIIAAELQVIVDNHRTRCEHCAKKPPVNFLELFILNIRAAHDNAMEKGIEATAVMAAAVLRASKSHDVLSVLTELFGAENVKVMNEDGTIVDPKPEVKH